MITKYDNPTALPNLTNYNLFITNNKIQPEHRTVLG